MNCGDVRDLMPQHVAGELEDADFETHLALCASCARHEELTRVVWGLSGLVPDEPLPDEAIQDLYDSIERVRRRPQRMLVLLLRLGTVAAAAVLLSVGTWWMSRERVPDPPRGTPLMDGTGFSAYLEPAVGSLEVSGGPLPRPLGLRSHRVSVDLSDWVLRTEVEEIFVNTTGQRLEGTFYFPLPPDASLSRFAMEVNGTLVEGELVERVRARQVYEGIVRRMKDPALLEWMPGNIFKARIFPIEPYSEKRVILAYTQAPRMWNGSLTYVYPLASEKTEKHPPGEIDIRASYAFDRPVRDVASPTLGADVIRKDERSGQVRLRLRNERPTQHFRLVLDLTPEELAVAAHRPEGEDGYFSVGFAPRFEQAALPAGTYVFVVDRSARMSDADLAVARRVVLAMIGKLGPTDRVGLVAHHIEPRVREPSFVTPARQKEWRDFLEDLRGEGASDVLGALRAAAEAAPKGATIIYVGKGVPTYGMTEGGMLAQEAAAALRGRTFRAVVVGRGGNAAGLSLLAGVRDGDVRSIAPGGDAERQVASIARTIAVRPILGVELEAQGAEVRDVVSTNQGAVYPGERIFLFGRYAAGDEPKTVTVTVWGYLDGRRVERRRDVVLPAGPTDRRAVMRLWAQRILAARTAACQRAGEPEDRRREIVEMSRRYQVMTPYTSFLVLESEKAYKKHRIERVKRLEEEGGTEEGSRRPDPSPRPYETAVRLHDRGDFEGAKDAARRAVERHPGNRAARQLLDDLNQLTVSGQPEYSARSMAEDELRQFRVRIEQAQIEITKHVRDGERYYNARMYEEALKEFENAEFKIRAVPYDVRAMNDLLPRVQDSLAKNKIARIFEESRIEQEKRRMAEASSAAANDIATKREVTRALARLLEESYDAFARKRFDQVIKLADAILAVDPHYTVALELKEDAQKTRHKEEYYPILARKVAQWRRLTDTDEEALIPWSQTVRFPDRKSWGQISKRLTEGGLTREDPLVLAVHRKLGRLIDLEFEDTGVGEILDFIGGASGIEITIGPEALKKLPGRTTIVARAEPLSDVLRRLLEPFGLAYAVAEDQAGLIVAEPAWLSRTVVLRAYYVGDLFRPRSWVTCEALMRSLRASLSQAGAEDRSIALEERMLMVRCDLLSHMKVRRALEGWRTRIREREVLERRLESIRGRFRDAREGK